MFEISRAGRCLGTVTPVGANIIVHGADGAPLGQFGDLAAALARLLRAAA